MSRLAPASACGQSPTRKIAGVVVVALTVALASPLAAFASRPQSHAPAASWADRHAPHAAWSDARPKRASWSDSLRHS